MFDTLGNTWIRHSKFLFFSFFARMMECTSPASAAPSVRGACQERMTERITKEQQKPMASTYKSPAVQSFFF